MPRAAPAQVVVAIADSRYSDYGECNVCINGTVPMTNPPRACVDGTYHCRCGDWGSTNDVCSNPAVGKQNVKAMMNGFARHMLPGSGGPAPLTRSACPLARSPAWRTGPPQRQSTCQSYTAGTLRAQCAAHAHRHVPPRPPTADRGPAPFRMQMCCAPGPPMHWMVNLVERVGGEW